MRLAGLISNESHSGRLSSANAFDVLSDGDLRPGTSLRTRLIVGAAAIAAVAVFAAALAAWGTVTTSKLIEQSAAAQARIDLLSGLSARVNDYAVVAVETTVPSVPADARTARLGTQADRVADAFAKIDAALAQAVAASEHDGEAAQMRRATRSLVVARMGAQFDALARSVSGAQDVGALRVHLDGFATQFSPLINEIISEEQRDRDFARVEVAALRDQMIWAALGAGLVAAILLVLFYVTLVRPLISQLAHIRDAAAGIGEGNFSPRLPAARSLELNLVTRELGRTAKSLREREFQVETDRAGLNQTIAERTTELEQANLRLSRIDGDRRRFFADIGHELRTPLTVILAEAELGLRGPIEPGEASESLSVIHARARRLNRRIDDLLRVARSETGQIQLGLDPFDLAVAGSEAVADLQPLARRRGIRLEASLAHARAIGDADWCRQVICGLIENALKHSQAGCSVDVSTAIEGELAIVRVTDDGPGLSPEEIDTVFTRFAQGSREASGSGFGVGLALARWVAEQQSGKVSISSPAEYAPEGASAKGPGITVRFALPVAGTNGASNV